MNAITFWIKKRNILKKQRKNYYIMSKNIDKSKIEIEPKDKVKFLSIVRENNIYNMELKMLFSRRYSYLCGKLQLPEYYEDEGIWGPSNMPNEKVLTDKGLTKLKSAIRSERRERAKWIFSFGSLIVGFIAALTGLIAVIGSLE